MMIEVYPRLWVGSDQDYLTMKDDPEHWYFLQCAKDPWHRQALGYTGRAAPKDHPEYLFAYRDGNKLILNMVDADNPKYFPHEMIIEALDYIDGVLTCCKEKNLLAHCNKGESRAPSLALLWVGTHIPDIPHMSFRNAYTFFEKAYPQYDPNDGIYRYLEMNWDRYIW